MVLPDCTNSPWSSISPCTNMNASIQYTELESVHVITIEDCCYCLLKKQLSDVKIIEGTMAFTNPCYIPNQYVHIDLQDGSTLYNVMTRDDGRLVSAPMKVKATMMINDVLVSFLYDLETHAAEFRTEDLSIVQQLLSLLSRKSYSN